MTPNGPGIRPGLAWGVAIELVFETHSITEDNEWGRATGWLPGRLSPRGRELARELGLRRRDDGIAAVFSSDLRRAAETATLAFEDPAIPVLLDWRLRECDYGRRNGMPVAELHASRSDHLDRPYPGGESWRQAVRGPPGCWTTCRCAGTGSECWSSGTWLPAGPWTTCSAAFHWRN
jgi:broad specificity phosphatase PhoE